MSMQKKSVWNSLLAFGILSLVSFFRQINIAKHPDMSRTPLVVYVTYLLLLGIWFYSIAQRFQQSGMRKFLYGEIGIMVLWMSVRFHQDEFFYKNLLLMRVSGYFIVIPMVFIPLLGFYASLGLGKGEDYHINRKWLWLLLPSLILTLLMLTNEVHGLVFKYHMSEEGINLRFDPNFGVYLIAIWAGILEFLKIAQICKRGYRNKNSSYIRFLPLIVALVMPLYAAPYFLSSFDISKELIEFSAGLFFLEAMVWESCVIGNMISVNSGHLDVFNHSTMGLQILDEHYRELAKSITAQDISKEQLEELKKNRQLETPEGIEFHFYPMREGHLIWQKDVSQMRSIILELEQTAEQLEQESTLLNEEVWARTEETKTQIKNDLYSQLTQEVGEQLEIMQNLLNHTGEIDSESVLRKLNILGIYVKRRCNLRLIEQETGSISKEDMQLSMEDFANVLREADVKANVCWKYKVIETEFFLFSFDVVELLMEHEEFQVDTFIKVAYDGDRITITVRNHKVISDLPVEKVYEKNEKRYQILWSTQDCGYQLVILEKG